MALLRLAQEIASGMAFLHANGVLHGDLKVTIDKLQSGSKGFSKYQHVNSSM